MSVFENPWHRDPSEKDAVQSSRLKIAAPVDRMAAFMVDAGVSFLILSLMIAPFRRELLYSVLNEDIKSYVYNFATILGIVTLALLSYHTLCTWKWGATLGKRIFRIKVVNIWTQKSPDFTESLLRSIIWFFSWPPLGLPFLEIFSNPNRRALHDRINDTMVVSLSRRHSLSPLPQERSFVRSVYASFVIVFFGLSVAQVNMILTEWNNWNDLLGIFSKEDSVCESVTNAQESWPRNEGARESRLHIALSLYATDQIDESCLDMEARRAFFFKEELAEAYLAKAFATAEDPELSDQYLDKVCEVEPDGESCSLTKVIVLWTEKKWEEAEVIFKNLEQSKNSYVNIWAIKHFEKNKKYDEELKVVQKLWPIEVLKPYLGTHSTIALWGSHRREESRQAFLSTYDQLDDEQKDSFATWMCDLELDDCSVESYGCAQFLGQIDREDTIPGGATGLTYIKSMSCNPEFKSEIAQIKERIEDPQIFKFVTGIESQLTSRTRDAKRIFDDLLDEVQGDSQFEYEVQSRRLDLSSDSKDLFQIQQDWEADESKSWYWLRLGSSLSKRYIEINDLEGAIDVAQKVLENDPLNKKLKQQLIVSLFKSGRTLEARKMVEGSRSIASEDDFLNVLMKLKENKK